MYQSWKLTKVLSCDPPTSGCINGFGELSHKLYAANSCGRDLYVKLFACNSGFVTQMKLVRDGSAELMYEALRSSFYSTETAREPRHGGDVTGAYARGPK